MPGVAKWKLSPGAQQVITQERIAADWELTTDTARPGEKVGYAIVLTVHDEVICEAPDEPEWNPEHLAALLAEPPPWADGLPLAAAGFESKRYKKG